METPTSISTPSPRPPPSFSNQTNTVRSTSSRKIWQFDPNKRIRYKTNAEYEEHFRTVLAKAFECRLRSDRPVLAELSGGMDSSSIVGMAHLVIARGQAECPRLDTISWFDDSLRSYQAGLQRTSLDFQSRTKAGSHLASTSNLRESRVERRYLTEDPLHPNLKMIALRQSRSPTEICLITSISMRHT